VHDVASPIVNTQAEVDGQLEEDSEPVAWTLGWLGLRCARAGRFRERSNLGRSLDPSAGQNYLSDGWRDKEEEILNRDSYDNLNIPTMQLHSSPTYFPASTRTVKRHTPRFRFLVRLANGWWVALAQPPTRV